MSNSYLVALLCISISIGIFVWYVLHILTAVPDEDRTYLDKPPVLFHILWYPIRVASFYVKPFLNEKKLASLLNTIVTSGYDFVFKPEHIVGSQIVFAVFFGLMGLIATSFADVDSFYSLLFALYGFIYPNLWLKSETKKRQLLFLKEMPFFLDIVVLCVEAGLTLNKAMQHASEKGPAGPTKKEFERALRDMRAGKPRSEALKGISSRVDDTSFKNLISSIIQAENMGMSLGPILRNQAEQRRVERFLRAEKLAMEAPVKMLLPLVAFIFPCTFIVIGFPVYVMMKSAFA